eukprot:TRINITY_DN9120_c0_g1_i1.p1 TRINITY_DN9120_c0_g1~~TRINITY_DN9120_c0_g1_i1.p1  ORF type:complete len:1134 (+),score=208.98 TRINITY_DN9120_c0_g1_i1:58-3459(+)
MPGAARRSRSGAAGGTAKRRKVDAEYRGSKDELWCGTELCVYERVPAGKHAAAVPPLHAGTPKAQGLVLDCDPSRVLRNWLYPLSAEHPALQKGDAVAIRHCGAGRGRAGRLASDLLADLDLQKLGRAGAGVDRAECFHGVADARSVLGHTAYETFLSLPAGTASSLELPAPPAFCEALLPEVAAGLQLGACTGILAGLRSGSPRLSARLLAVRGGRSCSVARSAGNVLILQCKGTSQWSRAGLQLEPGDAMLLPRSAANTVVRADDAVLLTVHVLPVTEAEILRCVSCAPCPKEAAAHISRVLSAGSRVTEHSMRVMTWAFPGEQAGPLALCRSPFGAGLWAGSSPLEVMSMCADLPAPDLKAPLAPLPLSSVKLPDDEGRAQADFFKNGITCADPPPDIAEAVTALRRSVLQAASSTDATDGITDRCVVDGSEFFPVHYRRKRQDIAQELGEGGPAQDLLTAVLQRTGVGRLLESVLGAEARLCECSCLVPHPGARAQPPHSDTTSRTLADSGAALCVSVFIPLVDVTPDMGPLDAWPGSHGVLQLMPDPLRHLAPPEGSPPFREFFSEEEELDYHRKHASAPQDPRGVLFRRVAFAVPAGSAVVMDSRLMHRGGANCSDRRRPVFYVTFASEKGAFPEGSTYSLSEKVRKRGLTLRSFAGARPPPPAPAELAGRALEDTEWLHSHLHGCAIGPLLRQQPPEPRRGAKVVDPVLASEKAGLEELWTACNAALKQPSSEQAAEAALSGMLWMKAALRRAEAREGAEPLGSALCIQGYDWVHRPLSDAGLVAAAVEVGTAAAAVRCRPELAEAVVSRLLPDAREHSGAEVVKLPEGMTMPPFRNDGRMVVVAAEGSARLLLWRSQRSATASVHRSWSVVAPIPDCSNRVQSCPLPARRCDSTSTVREGRWLEIPCGTLCSVTALGRCTLVLAGCSEPPCVETATDAVLSQNPVHASVAGFKVPDCAPLLRVHARTDSPFLVPTPSSPLFDTLPPAWWSNVSAQARQLGGTLVTDPHAAVCPSDREQLRNQDWAQLGHRRPLRCELAAVATVLDSESHEFYTVADRDGLVRVLFAPADSADCRALRSICKLSKENSVRARTGLPLMPIETATRGDMAALLLGVSAACAVRRNAD